MPLQEAEERIKKGKEKLNSAQTKGGVDLDIAFLIKLMEEGTNMEISKDYREQLQIEDPLEKAIQADYAGLSISEKAEDT